MVDVRSVDGRAHGDEQMGGLGANELRYDLYVERMIAPSFIKVAARIVVLVHISTWS